MYAYVYACASPHTYIFLILVIWYNLDYSLNFILLHISTLFTIFHRSYSCCYKQPKLKQQNDSVGTS